MRRVPIVLPVLLALAALAGCLTGSSGDATSATEAPLLGATYFVDPVAGPDNGSCTTPERTFRDINKALACLRPGDTLKLKANAHYPSTRFLPTLKGEPGLPITIEAWDVGTKAIFDPGPPAYKAPAEHEGVEWEEVPCSPDSPPEQCHADEWRTKDDFPGNCCNQTRGRMLSTGLQLVTHAYIQDLRAVNQSLHKIKATDSRPGPGTVRGDPSRKYPWTYFGPGISFVPNPEFSCPARPACEERFALGRVHIRLSPTSFNAPGLPDYAGPTDPNEMSLSLTPQNVVAARIESQFVVFKNIVFQSGGDFTVTIPPEAKNLTFDHCEIRGGTYGVSVYGSSDVTFTHCLFDGSAPPWLTRSEVKDMYHYQLPDGRTGYNDLAAGTTHTLVMDHGSDNVTYEHCTFRRGHDAISIRSHGTTVHHSLFEDINDETLQFGGNAESTGNIHVYQNVIRQTLIPFSFVANARSGPVYIYRNIVDQRIPVRGTRVLGKDAPEPWIWRWGSDVKPANEEKGGVMPRTYVYQNTFIASHTEDKGSAQSDLFLNSPLEERWFYNNLHLGLNLDPAIYYGYAYAPGLMQSDGNLWYRYPLGCPGSCPKFFLPLEGRAVLPSALPPGWDAQSLFDVEPALANFNDEHFDYQGSYPNNDFRPTVVRSGISLPASLPDPVGPGPGGWEKGALRVGDAPLVVGVNGEASFPTAGVPVAHAGNDVVIADISNDGFESITVDGGLSTDPDGSIASYRWSLKGKDVATGVRPTILVAEGTHYLRLTVTDNTGKTDSDAIQIQVGSAQPRENSLVYSGFEESESACTAGATESCWQLPGNASISPDLAWVHYGRKAVLLQETTVDTEVVQQVPATAGDRYHVSGWIRTRGIVGPGAGIRARFKDAQGAVLETIALGALLRGNNPYTYRSLEVVAPAATATLEVLLVAEHATTTGQAYFDDLRVGDRDILSNGGFEIRAPNGQDRYAPGWNLFQVNGSNTWVVDDLAQRRSGFRGVAMIGNGNAAAYNMVWRENIPVTGSTQYRFSMWLKTTPGMTAASAPFVQAQFVLTTGNGGLDEPFRGLSPNGFTRVTATLTAPANAVSLRLRVRLPAGATGTAFVDDIELVPVP
jgi:hypothetical protein